MPGPALLACLAVDGRKPKTAGQLRDLLSGLGNYLDAVLQEYGCTQIHAFITQRGGLRVQLIAPVASGPAAVTDDQESWQLDVTIDSGNGMDWAKLLSTPLVCLPAQQQQPQQPQQQDPPRGQVLPIQQATAAAFWQLARHIKVHEADLLDLQAPAQARAGNAHALIIPEVLQTASCAFYSRLLWHLSNKYRPSAQQLQARAGQFSQASLWLLVAAPPYAQHSAAVGNKQWATDVCTLVALLHQLQLLAVGAGSKNAVMSALHRLKQIATIPPDQLQPQQEQQLSQQQAAAVTSWLSSYGIGVEHVIAAAASDDIPDNIAICCHCGEDDSAGTPLVPCRSCAHEYHVTCASSESSSTFPLAPNRKQLKRGTDGKGVCLACEGFPLSGECWLRVYQQQEQQQQPDTTGASPAAAAAAGDGVGVASQGKKAAKQQQQPAAAANPTAAAAAGQGGAVGSQGRTAAATPRAAKKQRGGSLDPAAVGAVGEVAAGSQGTQEAAATVPNKKRQRLQAATGRAAAAAATDAAAAGDAGSGPESPAGAADGAANTDTAAVAAAAAEGPVDEHMHEEGWDLEDDNGVDDEQQPLPTQLNTTQANGSLLPTQVLQQDSQGAAAAAAQGGSGSDGSSSGGSGSGSDDSNSEGSSSSLPTSGRSSDSNSSSSSEESDKDNQDKDFRPSNRIKAQVQQGSGRPAPGSSQPTRQVPTPAATPGGGSTPRRVAKAREAAAAAASDAAGADAAAAAAAGADAAADVAVAGRTGKRQPAATPADAAAADGAADVVHASPTRGPRRAAAANAAAAIAAQAAAGHQTGSPSQKQQQQAAPGSSPAGKAGRPSRAAVAAAAAAAAAAAVGETPRVSHGSQTFSAPEAADALLTLFADMQQDKDHGAAAATAAGEGGAGRGKKAAAAAAGKKTAGGKGTPKGRGAAGAGHGEQQQPDGAAAAGGVRQGVKRGRQAAAAAAAADGDAGGSGAAAAAASPAAKRARRAVKGSQQQEQQQLDQQVAGVVQEDKQQLEQEPQHPGHEQQDESEQDIGAAEVEEQMQIDQQQQEQQEEAAQQQQQQDMQDLRLQQQKQQLARVLDQEVLLRLRRLSLLLLSSAAHRTLQRQLLMLLGEESQPLSKLVAVTLLALFAPAAGPPKGGAAGVAQALAADAAAVLAGVKSATAACLGDPTNPPAGVSGEPAAAAAGQQRKRVSVGSSGPDQVLQGWDWDALAASSMVGPLVALLDAQAQLDLARNRTAAAGCAEACLGAFTSVYYQAAVEQDASQPQQQGRRDRPAAGRAGAGAAGVGDQQQQQGQDLLELRRDVLLQVLLTARELTSQLHQVATSPAAAELPAGHAAAAAGGDGAAAAASGQLVCSFGSLVGQVVSAAAAAVADDTSSVLELRCCRDTCAQLSQLGQSLGGNPVQLLLLTDWHHVQRVLLSDDSDWAGRAAFLRGLHGFIQSCMGAVPAPGADADQAAGAEGGAQEGGDVSTAFVKLLKMQGLPTGMGEHILQVLGSAGRLSAQVKQRRQPNGHQQHGAHGDVSAQEREAGVQEVLPLLYVLLQEVLVRVTAAAGQQEALLAGLVLFGRQAVHMAGAVLGVLLLPDGALGVFVRELQDSVGKGVVDSTVGVLEGVVQPELQAGCYYNAAEALRWWGTDCESVVRRAGGGGAR